MVQIVGIEGIQEVPEGCDLGALLGSALESMGIKPVSRDVLVVTQKIVSKAEGRAVILDRVQVTAAAAELARKVCKDARLVQLVLDESTDIVRAVPNVLITRHRTGHVMANAGIDQSNLGPDGDGRALLLPQDPDLSASRLYAALGVIFENPPAVVISDSFGRPWRNGVVNVAIGAAGLPSLIDKRGELDRDGRSLQVTQVAFADMVASASGLATGEGAEGIPAALVRGLHWNAPEASCRSLIRPAAEDLFR